VDEVFSGLFIVFGLMVFVYALDTLAGRLKPFASRVRFIAAVAGFGLAVAAALMAAYQFVAGEDVDIALIALGAAGLVLGVVAVLERTPARRLFPRGSDDGRFEIGLVLLLWLVIFQLTAYYADDGSIGEISVTLAVMQALTFLAVALASVGFMTRRGPAATLSRLGLDRVTARDIWVGTLAVIPILVFSALSVVLVDWVSPGASDRLADTVEQITGGDTSLGYALVIGITAAVGEETLFRGAIQPKYGLVFTALIFALLHVQYDFLLVVASLFPIGIVLGLERKYLGTAACIVTHMIYNALAVAAG